MLRKLEDMCYDQNFNRETAIDLIKRVDINQEFESSAKHGGTYPTTLQSTAIKNSNIEMLKLLLENGADPNQVFWDEESELWNLQYNSYLSSEIDEIRLQMAQLLLEYGANPNMKLGNEQETLFEWVWYEVCNESYGDSWKYISRFFILLVVYGGKAKNWTPKILKDFDKSNMKKYRFWFLEDKINDYCGIIVDDEEDIVAYI